MNDREIFMAALDHDSPEERNRYLDEACSGDCELRRRVEALLQSYADSGSFLERPVLADEKTMGLNLARDPARADPPADDLSDPPDPNSDPISLDFLEPTGVPNALGRLGQYEILSLVGRGGMGVVLKANDTKLNRIVAVKVLAPELASNAIARKRFIREAQAAAAVSHHHVVTIYAVEDDRVPYLAMEFIDGQSLQEKIDRQGQLHLREILRIGQQLAAGLAAAHGHGIIHRDIKPANILLQNGIERVQITDFGLARAMDDVEMTRPGEVTGTPQFMSPEQAQGRRVDPRSDLFSLGSVLYTMCTGRPPFRADTTVAVLRRICDDTPRPIPEVNPDVPDWLVEIVERLLAKQPEHRFQTAKEVAEIFGRHLAHVQDPGSSPFPGRLPAAERGSGDRSHRRSWLVATMILLAVVVSLVMTELMGVTRLTTSVIRLVTGEGTLVIKIDDPTVSVTIDGRQLPITGAGVEEVKLRPGKYLFKASRKGQPLREELVTITRGGREVVQTALESSASNQVDLDKLPSTLRQTPTSSGKWEARSEDDWNKAVELAPDDPLPRLQRAFAYARRGELKKANTELASADSLESKPGSALRAAEVRFALGKTFWDAGLRADAHRVWQAALVELHKVAMEALEDQTIQQRVASCEREICLRYAAMGLWDLAATFPQHNAALKRMTDYWADTDLAVLLAATGQQEAWLEYCQYVMRQLKNKSWGSPPTPQIARTGCLLDPPAVDAEECITLANEYIGNLRNDPQSRFFAEACLVLGQCRAYRYSDALKLIEAEPLRSQWSGYLYALALEGAGRKEDALEHLQRAEGLHQSMICRPTLAPGRMDLAGGYDKLPHELAASHVLRREAWQKIRGESPPDDRWWHLIQARGYGLLEESERAEKEFAAAVAEAPDDPEIWIARALVFEQLGDAARAENDRNRAAKLGAGAEASGSASPRK